MKLFKYIFSGIVFAMSMTSCVDETEAPVGTFKFESEVVSASVDAVKFRVKMDFIYPIENIQVTISPYEPVLDDSGWYGARTFETLSGYGTQVSDGIWEIDVKTNNYFVSGLQPNTTYYYWFEYRFTPSDGQPATDYGYGYTGGSYMPEHHTIRL